MAPPQNSPMYPSRYKTAGALQALTDMGLTKEAGLWGSLWKYTGGKLVGAAAKPFEWGGRAVGTAVSEASPTAGKFLRNLTRGSARDMASFGLLGGGINAAMADPNERWDAFQRGFGGGALGGLAWRVGSRGTQIGMQKGLGKPTMRSLVQASHGNRRFNPVTKRYEGGGVFGNLGQGHYGTALKSLGAKTVLTGAPFAGAMGLSMLTPEELFAKKQQNAFPTPGGIGSAFQR